MVGVKYQTEAVAGVGVTLPADGIPGEDGGNRKKAYRATLGTE